MFFVNKYLKSVKHHLKNRFTIVPTVHTNFCQNNLRKIENINFSQYYNLVVFRDMVIKNVYNILWRSKLI